jgi:molybdate transport system regulatory protein
MPLNNDFFRIRSKIWIEDKKGNVVFGRGRFLILEAVERTGSLQAAAKELRMSYLAIWRRIRASEERLGKPLVVRAGRGSRLTDHAHRLMKQFKKLQAVVEKESDEVYDELVAEYMN